MNALTYAKIVIALVLLVGVLVLVGLGKLSVPDGARAITELGSAVIIVLGVRGAANTLTENDKP